MISGDVERNPGPRASDRPVYNQLLYLKNANLKIIQRITSLEQWQCIDFAHMLLKDDVLVNKYERESKKDEFVRKVLNDWLSRNDDDPNDTAVPRTWAALAECVTDAGLPGTLTKAINDACPPADQTKSKNTRSNYGSTLRRSLRNRRTLPDPADPVVDGGSTSDNVLSSSSETEEEETDGEDSTASSDISDWSTEMEMDFISSRKRSKRRRRRYSDESSQESGSSSDEQDEPVKKKKKPSLSLTPEENVDLTAYWPSDWLKSTKPRPSPYFPQVGDIVVYCRQGHELYCDAVRENKVYPWKHQQMPWEKFTLRPHELCKVRNVHFVVGPPTLCSITLALLSPPISDAPCFSQQNMATNQQQRVAFTFKFHDMDNVLDFIILEQVYKDSLKQQWSVGDRFRSLIDDQYLFGTILKRRPFSEDAPNSVWQSYHIRWDDGATDQLSPWDLHPLETETVPRLRNQPEWDREMERILHGLDTILKNKDKLEEADMFLDPVNLKEEPTYCTVVPFPTCVSTIAERLRNGFYRQKIALIWEVVLLARNALAYNEEDSLIVRHGNIFAQTLLKFIKTPLCSNIMECHLPDLSKAVKYFAPANSSPVKAKSKEQEVVRRDVNNSSQLQRKKQVDDREDVAVHGRVTRSAHSSYKKFTKLNDSYNEEETESGEESDSESGEESDEDSN